MARVCKVKKISKDDLLPMMVFKNTWYEGLKDGIFILLSYDKAKDLDRLVWKCAFSSRGAGAKILELTDEEVLKCVCLGKIIEGELFGILG